MLCYNATDVRKDFGMFIDKVVREKPRVIKRSRDYIMAVNIDMMKEILKVYEFTVDTFKEEDNSITMSLNEIDIVVNAEDEEKALHTLAHDLLEYAEEFYDEFDYWSTAPNRKAHLPYVMKVLLQNNIEGVKSIIKCQSGKK